MFHVPDEERGRAFALSLYFSLSVAVVTMLKPVQVSLFLAEFGAEELRYAYVGEGLYGSCGGGRSSAPASA